MLPFGIGTGEILMIFLVTFVVLGPSKIPEIARAIGKGLKAMRELTDEVKNSPEFQEIKNEVYQPIKNFDPKKEINQFINQSMDSNLDKTSQNLDPHQQDSNKETEHQEDLESGPISRLNPMEELLVKEAIEAQAKTKIDEKGE